MIRRKEGWIWPVGRMVKRWTSQICRPYRAIKALREMSWYFGQLMRYRKIRGAESIRWFDTYPCLNDRAEYQTPDPHYFYQNLWAFMRIKDCKPEFHVDVGSLIEFIGFLSEVTRVFSVDFRPLKASLRGLDSIKGDILSLPFADGSVSSLSCLHVAEHIGLGRYGDSLEPRGTLIACKELSRVLAKGGRLYFSVPVGKPRVCFNAHRIHSPQQIINYFSELKMEEFSCVDDEGYFHERTSPNLVEEAEYGCGFFLFRAL